MWLEQKINYQLNKFPIIKVYIKRIYQLAMYAISPKIKSEGNIVRISPNESREYFFGYYDKSPWDASMRYMICMRAKDTWSNPDPKEEADILLIDTDTNVKASDGFMFVSGVKVKKIATTRTWNVQQGCMAQWLGPDFSSRIVYNDMRDGRYCSVIYELATGKEHILPMPVYTVSQNAKIALSLDFSRLHNLRLGYGYAKLPEITQGIPLPNTAAIWKMDMMLYRWFCGQRKYTRLITCNIDGTDMYVLSDDDMVSHCYWKNDEEIIAFENKKDGGPGYYLMKDKTREYQHLWPQLSNDGHPSYCPVDNSLVVIDSYPDRARMAEVKLVNDTEPKGKNLRVIAKVFAPFKYDNDTRCDLHPRWRQDGKSICFDAVFEGKRNLYVVNLD